MTLDVSKFLPADGEALARRGLSTMALGLVGSEILKIAGEVRQMIADGQSVVNLTVGDFSPSEFRIPARLEAAVTAAYAEGQTNYPPSDGLPELRAAVKRFLARAQGLDFPLASILVSGGARPLLYGAYRAVCEPGDTVVYPVPSWNNNHYVHMCAARGVAVPCRAENAFLPTPADLLPHLRGARLLVLNSPLNPTGTAFTADALRELTLAVVDENRRREATGERALFVIYDQVVLDADAARHEPPRPHPPRARVRAVRDPHRRPVESVRGHGPSGWAGARPRPRSPRGCATSSATWARGRRGPSRRRPR
jgi:aspartate aminotransferase